MGSTEESLQIQLSSEHTGLARLDAIEPNTMKLASELLQKNHDLYHMFFRDVAGHNHIPHSLLTVLAMGGGPVELNRAYNDGEGLQRPMPPIDAEAIKSLSDPEKFRSRMLKLSEYSNFLVFFKQEIGARGWQAVLEEYCFSRTPLAETMLSQLYEGLYHPIIHLGFGVEFNQPSLIAESLAHAAAHDPGDIDTFFNRSELLANSGSVLTKPLVELYAEVRSNEKIRSAARIQDGPLRGQGVLKRAMDELVTVASQYRVSPDQLERATAEMLSCSAYTSAAQKPGKQRKIDFFYLHIVTCSLALDVLKRQTWLKIEDKIRLLEWKVRLDLVWYAANGSAELKSENISGYIPTLSQGMDWPAMYKAANDIHDDGHVVKFIRALKNGEDVVKPFEKGPQASHFPVRGDDWLKIAQMCYDSTSTIGPENPNELSRKWVWGAGFDPAWMKIPNVTSK